MNTSANNAVSPMTSIDAHVDMPFGEHRLSFGERAERLYQMVEQGYVPTEEEFLEIQGIVGRTNKPMRYDYDEGDVGRGDFVGPNNEPISDEVALGLWGAAQPTRWLQRPNDEKLLADVASWNRRHEDRSVIGPKSQRNDEAGPPPHVPQIIEATKTLVPNAEQLTSETLERLAALSRLSRKQLEDKGADVEQILAQRGRATASVPAISLEFDPTESIAPQGIKEGDDAKVIPHVGKISARAAVMNPKTGKPIEYAETIPEGEIPLRWFILNDTPPSEVVETLRARRIGRESTYRYTKQLHKTRISKDLSDIQAEQANNLATQVAAFEQLEAGINSGGEVPDKRHIASVLFPGKEEYLNADDHKVIETAFAKLNYLSGRYDAALANKAEKVERYTGAAHAFVEAERWFNTTREAFVAFIEKASPVAQRVTRKIGTIAAGIAMATSFMSGAQAVDAKPPQPRVAVSSGSRARSSV